jgi:hypothetical protein
MRFEHIIEINSPSMAMRLAVPVFSREQLWQGLMRRVTSPQDFPLGPERCDCEELAPGLFSRTLHFGALQVHDKVVVSDEDALVFTPQAMPEVTPIRLTIRIEEPQAGQMALRFVYEALAELTAEENLYSGYRQNAWLANDRDMVGLLRQWLTNALL